MHNATPDRKDPHFAVRFIACLAILGALVVLAWFLKRTTMLMAYFGVAVVVTYLINPFVDALERRRMPRGISIMLIFILFAIVVTLATSFLAGSIRREVVQLVDQFPHYQKTFQSFWDAILEKYHWLQGQAAFDGMMAKASAFVQQKGADMAGRMFRGVLSFFSVAMGLIVVPVLVYYFLKDDHKIRGAFLKSLPAPWRDDASHILDRINVAIGGFIRGQLKLCLVMGLLTWFSMGVVARLDYALIMGLIAGVTEFIPYLGPVLGIILPLAVAAFEGPEKIGVVVILFFVLQFLEGNILAPRIMSGDVGLHPVIIIFVLMAGGQVGGLLGMIIALPVTVILKVFYEHFYLERVIKAEPAAAAVAEPQAALAPTPADQLLPDD